MKKSIMSAVRNMAECYQLKYNNEKYETFEKFANLGEFFKVVYELRLDRKVEGELLYGMTVSFSLREFGGEKFDKSIRGRVLRFLTDPDFWGRMPRMPKPAGVPGVPAAG